MKRVVTSSEVPHLWMHQTQSSATNSNRSLYFEGETIYSYGSHFPIAKHVTNQNGNKAVLFTTRSHSVTTSGHKSAVKQAIPVGTIVFYVEHPTDYMHSQVASLKTELAYKVDAIGKARMSKTKAKLYGELTTFLNGANAFLQFMGETECLVSPDLPGIQELYEVEQDKIAVYARVRQAAIDAEHEKWERDKPALIENWRNGERVDMIYRFKQTFLRINTEAGTVETSRGANVPLDHAKRGLKLVEAARSAGRAYERNGHTVHLGHYAIDKIDEQGNITAGCHYIEYAEIARLAPQLEAVAV